MKKVVHKTVSALLAVLVLLSTVSWTVDKHLCMGRVMDIAIFSHAEDCGMEAAMTAFGEKENHCCDDESFTFQGQDDLQLSWDKLDLETQQFLINFTYSYFRLFAIPSGQEVPEITYPPPLPVQDFTVLYEVFLI